MSGSVTTQLSNQLTHLPENCYRVSVKAYIQDEHGRVLVVKEGDDYWDMPGGGTEHLETFAQSLQREVQEEIGVEVIVGELREVIKFKSLSGVEAMFIIYNCSLDTLSLPQLGDATDLAWKDPSELDNWPFILMHNSL